MNEKILTADDQLLLYGEVPLAVGQLHPLAATAFAALTDAAAQAGIALQVASGYRSFERQLSIWNRKVSGELSVIGEHGKAVDMACLTPREQVFAILRWSSLPGASRHHWGTDLDVFDAACRPEGYVLQLTTEEACGMFGGLHRWLDERITSDTAFGFFRPYAVDRGGIAPEPWHLSYAPLASQFQQAFSLARLGQLLEKSDIALKSEILANLDEINQRFIQVPAAAYPEKNLLS